MATRRTNVAIALAFASQKLIPFGCGELSTLSRFPWETDTNRGESVARATHSKEMVVLINGSFGVGKTTIAKLLRDALPGSAIYDPELVGFVLMRAGKLFRLAGAGTDDFQDIPLWRRSVGAGVRLIGRIPSGPIIVPMTFTRRDYFDEVVSDLGSSGAEPNVFCLRGSLATIEKRIERRRLHPDGREAAWIKRRIRECVEAHRDSHFGEPVDTEGRSPREVAEQILQRLHPHASR